MSENRKNPLRAMRADSLILLAALCAALLCSLLISPLYISTANDIAFSESPLPMILWVLNSFLETLYFSMLAALVVCAVYSSVLGKDRAFCRIFGLCAAVILIKYVVNILSALLFDGKYDWQELLISLLPPVLDILILLCVMLLSRRFCASFASYAADIRRAGKYVREADVDSMTSVYPFPSFLTRKNPILLSLLCFACILGVIALLQRAYNDIVYGAPTSAAEVIEMVFAYLSDLLSALIAYTIAYFTALLYFSKKIKADKAE